MPPPPSPQQHTVPNTYLSTVLNTNSTASPIHSSRPGQFGVKEVTATQRSAQARGKEYNHPGRKEESYEVRQKREQAGRILESTEMLIWWSGVRNESISQTRHHFENIVRGIEDLEGDVVWKEEWEVVQESREKERGLVGSPRSVKGKEREKRRVSSGVHA